MKAAGIERQLRLAGSLLILGLAIELISLLWEKPAAFILFAFAGGGLVAGGLIMYLYSLVSVSERPASRSAPE